MAHQGKPWQALEKQPWVPESYDNLRFDIHRSSRMMRDSGSCLCVSSGRGRKKLLCFRNRTTFFPPSESTGDGSGLPDRAGMEWEILDLGERTIFSWHALL